MFNISVLSNFFSNKMEKLWYLIFHKIWEFFRFLFTVVCQLFFVPIQEMVFICVHIGWGQLSYIINFEFYQCPGLCWHRWRNEKWKKPTSVFLLLHKVLANFEAFVWTFSLSINLSFMNTEQCSMLSLPYWLKSISFFCYRKNN